METQLMPSPTFTSETTHTSGQTPVYYPLLKSSMTTRLGLTGET